jgi:SP family general alpha glucoside:H+ symporter-like MFS transporter
MAMHTVGLTDEQKKFALDDPESVDLIHHAQQSDAADRQLTVRQALKKYPKAVFWAMFLSTSLIMEGYDVVIVRPFLICHRQEL